MKKQNIRTENPVELKFSDNIVFGVWCRKNPELCKHILEIALDITIRDIVFVENERFIEPGINEHGIRLDVYVEDDSSTVYDVEMQTVDTGNLPKRTRYYQSAIDTDWLMPSQDYATLKKTIILFICCFDPFHMNLPRYRFRYREEENPSLLLGDGTERVFVNAEYVGELAKGEFGSFIHFVSTGESTSEFTRRIVEAMDELNRSDEGRSLMTLEMAMREAKEYARKQALKEGREQGLAEGREKGLAEGREQLVFEMLLDGDVSVDVAAKRLNLTVGEIQNRLDTYKAERGGTV